MSPTYATWQTCVYVPHILKPKRHYIDFTVSNNITTWHPKLIKNTRIFSPIGGPLLNRPSDDSRVCAFSCAVKSTIPDPARKKQ
ncbi:uncharacterized protein LACBIDRAFT_301943 [Laccaria bicolor S238N-H82]|uniref:Predicted protein n=1 Tax=Laccaria bicolor (strain S238N-H82 / ATCC MYA-4686) TaxID=486041 RepID=B0CPZ4_LACBS|nr:uncharacterized protein LACBIDRAFT_301943 [Laccaria bicolor S238N-H82]EDR15499.1 predicted protein [Laccaria bicolor S238N-H82]|eukprot:XP_001873707.1 predicted protein [Laccaria bicolor S238N-H82]